MPDNWRWVRSTTIAQYVLPRLLGNFTREHPRVHPTMISGNTEHIVEAVEAQRIALGLIEGPARSRAVKTEPFLVDELLLIAPAAHEWAELESIPSFRDCRCSLADARTRVGHAPSGRNGA